MRDVGGPTVHTDEVIAAIEAAVPGARITYADVELPFPADTGDPAPATPLDEGIADAIARFRDLLDRGLVASPPPDQRRRLHPPRGPFQDRGPLTLAHATSSRYSANHQ